jgi:uncharacterized RmlC-like cupin family protein
MRQPATDRPLTREREFVFGPEKARATILTTAAETDGRHDLLDTLLPAGAATPLHLHTRYEERVYVISGALHVWIGPERTTVRSGGFYHVPLHVPHMVKGGDEDTHAILISSPAGFAELIARTATPLHLAGADADFDVDRFMAVTTELGDVVLGPPGTTPGQ